MRVNMRREPRSPSYTTYSLSWQDASGHSHTIRVEGIDLSPSGLGVKSGIELPVGCSVHIEERNGKLTGNSVVRHCSREGGVYLIGLELDEETKKTSAEAPAFSSDYYSFLQISPNAESETIHRIYRFLASRFHPDNPETGDPEKFLLLKHAFETLSDPNSRAEYDASLKGRAAEPMPAMEGVDFLDGIEGEVNRRLAVLSILYERRRVDSEHPHVSLVEMENRMSFPREYLDFTTWYLRSKKYITREDNSDFALTALGVDYIEANYSSTPVLKRLLSGSVDSAGSPSSRHELENADGRERSSAEIFVVGSETERKRMDRKY